MKCMHCGINFDDSESNCPMCGARAGSRGRMSVPHYTGEYHTSHSDRECTHKTFTRKVSYTGPRRTRVPARIWILIAVALIPIIFVFFDAVLPSLWLSYVNRYEAPASAHTAYVTAIPDFDGGSEPIAPEPATPSDEYGDGLYSIIPYVLATDLPDGTYIEITPGYDGYVLDISSDSGTYHERGEALSYFRDPEEEHYDPEYPYEDYDCYGLYLIAHSISYTPFNEDYPAAPAIEKRMESGGAELWLYMYMSRGDGTIVLHDSELTGLFSGYEFVTFS